MAKCSDFSERVRPPIPKRNTLKSVLPTSHMRVTRFSRPNETYCTGLTGSVKSGDGPWRALTDMGHVVESSNGSDQAAGQRGIKHQTARESREKWTRLRGFFSPSGIRPSGCNAFKGGSPEHVSSVCPPSFFAFFWPGGNFLDIFPKTLHRCTLPNLNPLFIRFCVGCNAGCSRVQRGATRVQRTGHFSRCTPI